MFFLLFLILFLLLYAVSIRLTSSIYGLTFLVTGSGKFALGILALILMPGTIIHEMSHFLVATMLRIRTGKMTIFPETLEKGKIRAGKLEIGDCDPFRKTLIGIAPMIIGLIVIYFTGHFFSSSFSLTTHNSRLNGIHDAVGLTNSSTASGQQLTTIIGFYLLLTVSATMFSSPKDLESLIIVLPILTILFLCLYFFGLRISLTGNILIRLEELTGKLNFFLIITIVTDFIIVLLNQLGIIFFGKILGRKLVEK